MQRMSRATRRASAATLVVKGYACNVLSQFLNGMSDLATVDQGEVEVHDAFFCLSLHQNLLGSMTGFCTADTVQHLVLDHPVQARY